MNKMQRKVEKVFGLPWGQLAEKTKALKLEYERLLNSPSRRVREQAIGFKDDISKGAVRLYYTTNDNAQGGVKNGGGRGWYISGPVTVGCVRSTLVAND